MKMLQRVVVTDVKPRQYSPRKLLKKLQLEAQKLSILRARVKEQKAAYEAAMQKRKPTVPLMSKDELIELGRKTMELEKNVLVLEYAAGRRR